MFGELSTNFGLLYTRLQVKYEQGCHWPGKPGKSGNLNETSQSQGICLKIHGICDRIPKVREFCCLKFIFSQVEDSNFENFLGEHALNGLGLSVKLNLGLEKSRKSQGISYCLESGNPDEDSENIKTDRVQ